MFWPIVAIGMIGVLAGLRFRAPTLVVVAAIAAATSLAIGVTSGWSLQSIIVSTGIVLIAINCGYLAGIFLSAALSSRKSRQAAEDRSRVANN